MEPKHLADKSVYTNFISIVTPSASRNNQGVEYPNITGGSMTGILKLDLNFYRANTKHNIADQTHKCPSI
jgi:hypothetical protein